MKKTLMIAAGSLALGIALNVIAPGSIAAQCSGCGCGGGSGASAGSAAGVGMGGSGKHRNGDDSAVKNVLWNPAQAWAMMNAADKNLPIVLFFVEKDDEETRKLLSGQKVAEYSSDKAMFVIVPKVEAVKADTKAGPTVTGGGKTSKPDASAAVADSPVPVNKLLSEDLWKAYAISKAQTMVVTDWYGNSQSVYASVPKEGVLTKAIDAVPENFRSAEAKVDKELAKLEGHLAKGSDAPALRSALSIFKMDVWGFASVNTSIEKYREIVSRGRDRLKAVEAEGNVVALRKLKTEYKGTELDVEVDQAVARISAMVNKD